MAIQIDVPAALPRTARILVIGAAQSSARAITELLQASGRYHTHGARSIANALTLIGQGGFDAVVIDASMWCNDSNGLRQATRLASALGIVVIDANASNTRDDSGAVFLRAAADLHPGMLNEAITTAIDNARGQRRRDTMVRWLEREASTDTLSGLHNARAFDDALREACAPGNHANVGLLLLNVVGTGTVNHNYGREAGDRMLRHAALGISRSIRASDFAARLVDDTFAILVPGADMDVCRRIGRRIVQDLSRANASEWPGDIPVTVTVGMACGEDCEPGDLLSLARQQIGRYRPFMPAPPYVELLDNGPSVA